ncbi:GNAT family N-acetyltransferase [Paenibacillus agricola]|uniref:GNAT family N-acetyltransferase n=1 Tax=Paenibacillus agricola TaxID=2716264 RepID=A0ABX0J7G6_9BACL|nr:GNAT family N-acetyltransferase [Paenibacillus agricola]NHN31330.1 GNAT family N-acetyltransferase [Paenibacillus agricola]
MEFYTTDKWDEDIWTQAGSIYRQAFEASASKTEAIIRRVIQRKLGHLHFAKEGSDMTAMALTGKLEGIDALVIDYIAVREDRRSQGTGQLFLDYILSWARNSEHCDGVVVEIEYEDSPFYQKRVHFWQQSDFLLTSYVHTYKWVPEKYQAMYLIIEQSAQIPTEGELLFEHITEFHEKAYRR